MPENCFYQDFNLMYSHIQCTGCLCEGGRTRPWITCCARGLQDSFHKILHVRPTASLWFSNFKIVYGSTNEIRGRIEIPNLSEEHDDLNDVDIEARLAHSGPEAEQLKTMIRKGKGAKEMRYLLGLYVSQLRSEYSSGVILPSKPGDSALTKTQTKTVQTVSSVNTFIKKPGKVSIQEKKKRPKKKTSWKSNDFVFYISLFSLVGISSIIVVKLVKRL